MGHVYSLPVIGKPSLKIAALLSQLPTIWKERAFVYTAYLALMLAMPSILETLMDLGVIS
jgi:hypothetical protein